MYLNFSYLWFIFTAITLLVTFTHAQQSSESTGISLFTRLYDLSDNTLATLPQPMYIGYFSKRVNLDFSNQNLGYVRIVAALTSSLPSSGYPSSLDTPSTHTEQRQADRLKIVLWVPQPLTTEHTEVLIQSAQAYISQTMQMKQDGISTSVNLPVVYSELYIPSTITELEIEILAVSANQLYQRPICTRPAVIPNTFPCPSMILANEMLLPALINQTVITTLDRFISFTQPNFLADVEEAQTLHWQFNSSWFGVPLWSDTRVLGMNKAAFDNAGLKLPPPYGDWGQSNVNWTWAELLTYLQTLKDNGNLTPFKFFADQDEENRLIQMIASSNNVQIVDDNFKSALDNQSSIQILKDTIGKLWDSSNLLANLDFVVHDDTFNQWKQRGIQDPLANEPMVSGTPPDPTSAIVSILRPGDIKNGLNADGTFTNDTSTATILPALVPGTSFLGGSSLSIMKGSLNPSLAWGFTAFTALSANGYLDSFASIQNTPAPYTSLKSSQSSLYPVSAQQLASSAPFASPVSYYPFTDGFVSRKPFRWMIMEYAFMGESMDAADQRASILIDTLSLPECQGQTLNIVASQCDPERSYNYVLFTGEDLVLDTCQISYSQIEPFVSTQKCGFIDYRSPFAVSILVFAIILLVAIGLIGYLTIMNKTGGWIRSVSFPYLLTILLGSLILACLMFTLFGQATDGQCVSQGWLLVFGIVGFAGSLSTAAWFISAGRVTKMVYPRRTFFALSILALVNFIILLCWTLLGSDRPRAMLLGVEYSDISGGNTVTVFSPTCTYGNPVFLILLCIINIMMILTGALYAVKNRDVAVGYNEPKHLVIVLSLFLATMVAIIPAVLSQSSQIMKLFIVALGVFICLFISLMMYFIPKLKDATKKSEDRNGKGDNLWNDNLEYFTKDFSVIDEYEREKDDMGRFSVISSQQEPSERPESVVSNVPSSMFSSASVHPGQRIPEFESQPPNNSLKRAWAPAILRSPLQSRRNDSMYHSFHTAKISDISSIVSFTDSPNDHKQNLIVPQDETIRDDSSSVGIDEDEYRRLRESMIAKKNLRYADPTLAQMVRDHEPLAPTDSFYSSNRNTVIINPDDFGSGWYKSMI